jgi:hypothetical protein
MGEPALRVLMAGEKMDGKLPSAVTKKHYCIHYVTIIDVFVTKTGNTYDVFSHAFSLSDRRRSC